jgi:glycerol kinase
MLDVCLGPDRPEYLRRGPAGTFPIVVRREDGKTTWGAEAVMLSAGTNVEWLVDLGIVHSPAETHELAASVDSSDGVAYVPALLGLGTPHWDYGARGALLGVTRGSSRAHITRAVLEGIAQRGADLLLAAATDTNRTFDVLRVDGGMSANPTFIQALANATGIPVEVSPVKEATTLGAGYLAGLQVGTWADWDEICGTWDPVTRLEPNGTFDRDRWSEAVERAGHWHEDLSALDF